MDKKYSRLALMLGVYIFLFWIGFKTGAVHTRMKNRINVETIKIPQIVKPEDKTYYIVERIDAVCHKDAVFTRTDERHPIIRFFLNKKLKPLLKLKDIEIFDDNGDRIYGGNKQ